MRPKSLALLLLALGCGLVASIGITRLMKNGETDGTSGDTADIYVATADIGMGDLLTPQVCKLMQWPKSKMPTGAILRAEDVEGRRTRTKLYANEPILENRLFAKGVNQQGATAMIPVGYRVVPVKVDLVSGGSSLILPGDRVDVMIHLVKDTNRGILETVTRTILQDIKVFAVNDVLNIEKEKDGGKSIAAMTISLLVTPKQAAIVMQASQLGIVNLVMRSSEDDKQAPNVEVRPEELLGVAAKSRRKQEEPQEPPKVKEPVVIVAPPAIEMPKPRPTWTIRVLKPNGVDDVVFEQQIDTDPALPVVWKAATTTSGSVGATPPKDEPKIAAPLLVPEQPGPEKPKRDSKPPRSDKNTI